MLIVRLNTVIYSYIKVIKWLKNDVGRIFPLLFLSFKLFLPQSNLADDIPFTLAQSYISWRVHF
jgi:hypothetical protein